MESQTFIPEEMSDTIKSKISKLVEIDNFLSDNSKKIKSYKEQKKILIDELVIIFSNNEIYEYKSNNKLFKLNTRNVIKSINNEIIEQGIEEKIKNLDKIEDYKQITNDIVKNILKIREKTKTKVQSIKITNINKN